MKILGLDPSYTALGWSNHLTGEVGPSRCASKGLRSTPSKMFISDRIAQQRESVREIIQIHNPDKVAVESIAFGEMWSEGMYALFTAVNEAIKLERKDVIFFSPGQAKAHARESLGRPKGWKMMKPDMVSAAKADTGIPKWNHNEADAYLIARLAGRFWLFLDGVIKEPDLTPVETKQFARVHQFVRGRKAGEVEKTGLVYREGDRFFLWSKLKQEGCD